HLSLEGLRAAVEEICRVTREGICIGFFNMDEIPEHRQRPVEEYHWNTLSVSRMKELFAGYGFGAHVLHVGSFMRQRIGCEEKQKEYSGDVIAYKQATPLGFERTNDRRKRMQVAISTSRRPTVMMTL